MSAGAKARGSACKYNARQTLKPSGTGKPDKLFVDKLFKSTHTHVRNNKVYVPTFWSKNPKRSKTLPWGPRSGPQGGVLLRLGFSTKM